MDVTERHIQDFIDFVKENSKYDFSSYSIKSFTRRLNKLVADQQMRIPEILLTAVNDTEYLDTIIKNITVNTTELFRDPMIWTMIRKDIIPRYKNEEQINIWHPGVSTGQEMYSLMVLLDEVNILDKAIIIGTDLNDDVLKIAESGKYKYREIDEYIKNYDEAFGDDNKPLMSKYFNISKRKNLIKVEKNLTKRAKFIRHDLTSLKNPTDHKYQMIVCRNLLIYFTHEKQNEIFKFFYDLLVPGGTLVIGRHEGILSNIASKFEKKGTIYIKKEL